MGVYPLHRRHGGDLPTVQDAAGGAVPIGVTVRTWPGRSVPSGSPSKLAAVVLLLIQDQRREPGCSRSGRPSMPAAVVLLVIQDQRRELFP